MAVSQRVGTPTADLPDGTWPVDPTKISVDRAAAGVGWSRLGLVRGQAHLGGSIVLVHI